MALIIDRVEVLRLADKANNVNLEHVALGNETQTALLPSRSACLVAKYRSDLVHFRTEANHNNKLNIYCVCRGAAGSSPMVQCGDATDNSAVSGCHEWFHYTCVGYVESILNYKCDWCRGKVERPISVAHIQAPKIASGRKKKG
jgi:hypothetical protein